MQQEEKNVPNLESQQEIPNNSIQKKKTEGVGSFVFDLIKVVLIAFAIILPVRYFVAQPFIVSGTSMEPNFHTGEYLVIDELGYKNGNPGRGDVIVFKYPRDTTQFFIKRVIGLPGETVQITNGMVKIFNNQNPNGFFLPENYLPSNKETFGNNTKITLGTAEFYVLGDNRIASSDSRFWGTVPRNDIVGRVVFRAFPPQTIGTIP